MRYLVLGGVALLVTACYFYAMDAIQSGNFLSERQIGRLTQAGLAVFFIWLGRTQLPFVRKNSTSMGLGFALLAYISLVYVWGWRELALHESVRFALITILLLFFSVPVFRLSFQINLVYTILVIQLWMLRGYFTQEPLAYWIPNFIYVLLGAFGALTISITTEHRERELFSQRLDAQNARDHADAANRSKSYFFAAASHDIRQPLTALSLWIGQLRTAKTESKVLSITAEMSNSVENLRRMLDALLDLSNLDSGNIPLNREPANLNAILVDIQRAYLEEANAKNLDLRVICRQDFFIETDAVQFMRMVRNLTHNAINHTHKGTVTLRGTLCADGKIAVSVHDTGDGIAAADQLRIFDEYYQVGNQNRDISKGLGLGLSIVRRLSVLLDHPISVESELGNGSKFTILCESATEEPKTSEPPPRTAGSTDVLNGRVILVIEDDPFVKEALNSALTLLGATVINAANIEEAEEAVRKGASIVITDFRIGSELSGLDILQALRGIDPNVVGMILTGESDYSNIRELRDSEFPVLQKPISIEELTTFILISIS